MKSCGYFTGKEAQQIADGNIELSVTTNGVETPVTKFKVKSYWPIKFYPKNLVHCLLFKQSKTKRHDRTMDKLE